MPNGNYCMECGYAESYCECEEEFEWNKGYYFEAMDRCHTIMVMISELINGHPGIKRADAQKNIDKALGEIMEAYQKVGAADYDENKEDWT